jgi:hypothetical protein
MVISYTVFKWILNFISGMSKAQAGYFNGNTKQKCTFVYIYRNKSSKNLSRQVFNRYLKIEILLTFAFMCIF